MIFPRHPHNLHRSYDCDYTVRRDASSHYHVAEASREGRVLKPRMDVFEDSTTNMVTAPFEILGVARDKITIEMFNKRLTISGEIASYFGPNYGYILREKRTDQFVRTLELPANIPTQSIHATLEDGVLAVSFDHCVIRAKL